MQAQPEFALAFVPKIGILIGVIVVVGLVAALFSSRSWLGALGALFGLMLVGGVVLVGLTWVYFSLRSGSVPPSALEATVKTPPPRQTPIGPLNPNAPPHDLIAKAEAEEGVSSAPPSTRQSPILGDEPATQHTQWADWQTWTAAGAVRMGDVYRMPVEIGPYVTRAECDAEQPRILREAVRRYANQLLGEGAAEYVDLPLPYIFQNIVRADCEEYRETSVGRMLYVHNLLEFDRKVNDHLNDVYKQAVMAQRLKYAGTGAAGIFGLLATVFGYLKLDTLSRGYYTGRLRAAAVAAILGLVATLVLAAGLLVVA